MVTQKTKPPERKHRKKAGQSRAAAQTQPVEGVLRGSDLGAPLQLARGHVEFSIEVHVPDDPDDKRSLTRIAPRAQRTWAPDRLAHGRNPVLTPEHYQAAQRYYDDYLIGELGARRGPMNSGTRTDPWNRMPYSEQRAMRRQSFLTATKAVGQELSGVLAWCVLQATPSPDIPPTVQSFAESFDPPWGIQRAAGWLGGALSKLADHYGYLAQSRSSAENWRADEAAERKAAEVRLRDQGDGGER